MLNRDFIGFIESLNASGVRYLVIGGYAVAAHGHPRYTKDIDIWLDRTEANAKRVIEALDRFGFGSLGLTAADFLEPDQVVQLGYAPNRIDLLTSLAGIDFGACYADRLEVTMDDVPVSFIGLEGLRASKLVAGRHQDLADLENLA